MVIRGSGNPSDFIGTRFKQTNDNTVFPGHTGILIDGADGAPGWAIFQMECDATPFQTLAEFGVITPTGAVMFPQIQATTVASQSSCTGCAGGARWQQVFKNVNGPDCCLPRLKMVQNRADGVSGKIDRKYNHNYRQYLKKRCRIADYDVKMGSTDYTFNRGVIGSKSCCTTDCSNNTNPVSTYKRSNWRFRRQGGVDNDLYITQRKLDKLNICPCCPCEQTIRGDPSPPNPIVGETLTGATSGATGIIVNMTYGGGNYDFTVHLDDCENPFQHGETVNFSGGGGMSGITVKPATDCNDNPPVQRRNPPEDPAYNPQNYNKN